MEEVYNKIDSKYIWEIKADKVKTLRSKIKFLQIKNPDLESRKEWMMSIKGTDFGIKTLNKFVKDLDNEALKQTKKEESVFVIICSDYLENQFASELNNNSITRFNVVIEKLQKVVQDVNIDKKDICIALLGSKKGKLKGKLLKFDSRK